MAQFEFHHLIPTSLAEHDVFLALQSAGQPFTRWTLKLGITVMEWTALC